VGAVFGVDDGVVRETGRGKLSLVLDSFLISNLVILSDYYPQVQLHRQHRRPGQLGASNRSPSPDHLATQQHLVPGRPNIPQRRVRFLRFDHYRDGRNQHRRRTLAPPISQWTSYFVMIGTIIIAIWPLITAPTLQSASFVFVTFQNYTGWDNNVIVALIGLLPAAWNIVGFDASSHIAEETAQSTTSASWSLVWTVVFGAIGGYFRELLAMFGPS